MSSFLFNYQVSYLIICVYIHLSFIFFYFVFLFILDHSFKSPLGPFILNQIPSILHSPTLAYHLNLLNEPRQHTMRMTRPNHSLGLLTGSSPFVFQPWPAPNPNHISQLLVLFHLTPPNDLPSPSLHH